MTQLNMYGSCITEISECQVPRVNCQVRASAITINDTKRLEEQNILYDSRDFCYSAYS